MSSRQELYDRIRQSSRDEVILEEMIRLGFWPRQDELPADPPFEVKRKAELEEQLRELTSENSRLQNVEALKRAARKQRMEESRKRQQATKERRLQARRERAEAWRERKRNEILYLGDGVSTSLNERQSDHEKLASRGLPELNDAAELAAAMDVTVGELRFLAFHRRAASTTHYRRFAIPKKTGGLRSISAPMPRLKRAQEWVLTHILERVELHRAAHGFRRGRSIVTNAQPHVNSDVVINVDIENFFPTITYTRIRGVFKSLGYSAQLASILALICSEPEVEQVELDGRTYFVAKSERQLPQGAPSSPALTNIICRGLDARLDGIARRLGYQYTRYADDITFSGSGDAAKAVGRALRQICYVVNDEGFVLRPEKTRVLRRSGRQEVTGLIVNEKLGVRRDLLRRFRAVLFHIERDGPAGKRWGNSPHVMLSIEGFVNFVSMVDPEKGSELQARVRELQDRYGRGRTSFPTRERWQPRPVTDSAAGLDTESGANLDGRAKRQPPARKKPWWKFW